MCLNLYDNDYCVMFVFSIFIYFSFCLHPCANVCLGCVVHGEVLCFLLLLVLNLISVRTAFCTVKNFSEEERVLFQKRNEEKRKKMGTHLCWGF